MNNVDIALTLNSNNVYDISIDTDGDLLKTQGLDTACLMSVLCEKRADETEVVRPEYRRGDWSNVLNEIAGYEVGSKVWLLDAARNNEESINNGIDYLNDGFQWMLDEEIIQEIQVDGETINRGLRFTVSITKNDNSIEKKIYDVFQNTREI